MQKQIMIALVASIFIANVPAWAGLEAVQSEGERIRVLNDAIAKANLSGIKGMDAAREALDNWDIFGAKKKCNIAFDNSMAGYGFADNKSKITKKKT